MKVVTAFLVLLSCLWLATEGGEVSTCPAPSPDTTGTCSEDCSNDSDCSNGEKCCSNACGHVCTQPVRILYYEAPLVCPNVTSTTAGICVQNCESDSDCEDGELCCSNGCGVDCLPGEPASPLCPAIRDQVRNQSLVGAYVPQCEDDGSFSPIQCHASTGYCWCVHTQTGVPTSEPPVQFSRPSCGPSTFTGFFSCPPVEPGTAGICSEECSADTECPDNQKCCSNACGHTCADAIPIPYLSAPRSCPPRESLSSMCDLPPCDCADGLLCCANLCGSGMCVEGVIHSTPCLAIVLNTTVMPGAYIPTCSPNDGSFLPMQCHENYCWCVDPATGRPESDMVLGQNMGELECSGSCVYDGHEYEDGERFDEGLCGYCVCLGGAIACSQVEECGGGVIEEDKEELVWWHTLLYTFAGLIVVLGAIVVVLVVVVLVLCRSNKYQHKRLQDSASFMAFETDTDLAFKETIEMKVPGEDSKPTKT